MSKFKHVCLLFQFVISINLFKRFIQIYCITGCLTSFAQQQNNIDSLKIILNGSIQDTNKVNSLNKLSSLLLNQGNYEEARKYAFHAKLLSTKIHFKKGIAESLYLTALAYGSQENHSLALENYFASLKIKKEIGNKSDIAKTFNNIGVIFVSAGDYSSALEYCLKSLKLKEEIGDMAGITLSLITIGNIYIHQNNLSKALECFSRGLSINEKIGDHSGASSIMICIGNVYYFQGNFSKALEFYKESLSIKEKFNDKTFIIHVLNDIGLSYTQIKEYSKALEYYNRGIKTAKEQNDTNSIAYTYRGIGNTYSMKGNYSEAVNYLLKSVELYRTLNNKRTLAETYYEIGDNYDSLNQHKSVLEFYNKGILTAKENGSKEIIKNGYFLLSKQYSKLKIFKEAFIYFKKYSAYEDSLRGKEVAGQIEVMNANYENKKKEKEIEGLTQRNQILQQQNKIQQLQAKQDKYIIFGLIGITLMIVVIGLLFIRHNKLKALYIKSEIEQKLLRSQMNPHFIFNTMMGVQNLIYKKESEKAVKYLSSLVKLMRAILESSREEYVSIEKEKASLEHYLTLQQLRFIDKFDFAIKISPEIDLENYSIPPMIAQPFIENAIEHGIMHKPDGKGMITVNFVMQNESIILEIEDNGIGRDKAKEIRKQFKNEHLSVATNITQERLTVINRNAIKKTSMLISDLKNEKNEASGTKVIFHFPLIKQF